MSRRRSIEPEPFSEAAAERTAHIMGESSACAKALAELRLRRLRGESVGLFRVPGTILIGPVVEPAAAPRRGMEDEG